MNFRKADWKSVIEYLCYFGAFTLLNAVTGTATPFSAALLAALLYFGKSVVIAPALFLVSFLPYGAFDLLLPAAIPAAVYIVVFLIYRHFDALPKGELILYVLFSFTGYVLIGGDDYLFKIILSVIAAAFSVVCIITLKLLFVKGLKYKPSYDELICLGIFTLFFGLGVTHALGEAAWRMVSAVLILLAVYLLKEGADGMVSAVLALSLTVATGDLSYVGVFLIWCLAAACVMPFSRYLAAVALLLSDLVIFFAFPLYAHYGYLEMILLLVGCLLFALIPSKWLEKVKEQLLAFREKQLVRQTINRNRSMLSNRLYEISTVFLEMGNIFNSFQRHVMSEEKARAHISERIDAEICRSCENYKRCRQKRVPSPAALEKLAEIGIAKGRVSFIDLPKEISEQCIHANNLIFFLNKQLAEYRSYILESMNMDVGRQMIGAQAIGISEILKGLAVETAQTLKMQSKLEKSLSAALAQKGFFPSELLVYGEGEHTEVSMILPNREFALKPFCDAVGEAVGTDMTVSEKANVTEDKIFVTLRHAPRYDAVFGIAHAAKDGSSASGDTHSVLRIGPNRFLVALSDGMGSGEYAESVSGATLALIESFYRAGMSGELILGTVNKVLSINTEDSFTALDIGVVDLTSLRADFIKFGAPYGFIITEDGIRIVEGNSLPLGILEDLKPEIHSTDLAPNNMLVFFSDGISDAYRSSSEMIDFLRTLPAKNPQNLADEILSHAIALENGAKKDDMTVLCVRVFARR